MDGLDIGRTALWLRANWPQTRQALLAGAYHRPQPVRRVMLAPAIIQSILAGQQPRRMSLLWFQRNPLPTDWVAQREVVAGFDA